MQDSFVKIWKQCDKVQCQCLSPMTWFDYTIAPEYVDWTAAARVKKAIQDVTRPA